VITLAAQIRELEDSLAGGLVIFTGSDSADASFFSKDDVQCFKGYLLDLSAEKQTAIANLSCRFILIDAHCAARAAGGSRISRASMLRS